MLRTVRLSILLAAIMAACLCRPLFAAVNDSGVKITWGYRGSLGPEFWGRLSPYFRLCGAGKMQSPVNISKNDIEVANTLTLSYRPAPMVIMGDGKTRLQISGKEAIYNDGHTIQVNFQDNQARETIEYAGHEYKLIQLHFHSPSENQLNGESAPLEIHFVHQGDNGKVVVIGVLVKGGSTNPTLQTIINHLPNADGKGHAIKNEKINPRDLLPLDNDYYSFPGSLTAPPCLEGIQWIVMASTITASPAQIVSIRKAIGGSNARSVQPLNNRIIAYSAGKIS